MKKISSYNPETGEAVFKLIDGRNVYIGKARLHPDDKDVESRLTGLTLAELRARIKRENSKKREKMRLLKQYEHELSQIRKDILFYARREDMCQTFHDDFLEKKSSFQKKMKSVFARRKQKEGK